MATGTIKNHNNVVANFRTETANIAANGTSWLTAPSIAKSGYTPIGIVGYYCVGSTGVLIVPYSSRITNGVAYFAVRNINANAGTAYVEFDVLYEPN